MGQSRSLTSASRAAVARGAATLVRRVAGRGSAPGLWGVELPMPPAELPADRFREAMGTFPAPVSVVTALDEAGQPRGLTCSAVASVSMEPPTLLVCVNRRNGSLQAILRSGGFVVNLLRQGRDAVAQLFASGADDKFTPVTWRASPRTGLPWLADDALVYVDCRLVGQLDAGTHAVLIGLARDSGGADAGSDHNGAGALLYWRRTYGRWAQPEAAPLTALPATRSATSAGTRGHA